MNPVVAGRDSATPETSVATAVRHCLDCGTAFDADACFCPRCGQETRVRLPRVFDFLREAADETVGLSGRLPRTLGLLLFRPGVLTRDYIEGRRQRYVRPMRLYLSVSLVFFGLLGIATSDLGWIHYPLLDQAAIQKGLDEAKKDQAEEEKRQAERRAKRRAEKDASAAAAPSEDTTRDADAGGAAPADESSSKGKAPIPDGMVPPSAASAAAPAAGLTTKLDENPTSIPWINHRIDHFKTMPRDQAIRTVVQSMQGNAPYAAFILMPLAAFWYQLWYFLRWRRYAEHLLHSVHLHCFMFCLGSLALLPHLTGLWPYLVPVLGLYAWLAERRVYGSGWVRSFLGTFVGSFLYFIGLILVATGLGLLAFAL